MPSASQSANVLALGAKRAAIYGGRLKNFIDSDAANAFSIQIPNAFAANLTTTLMGERRYSSHPVSLHVLRRGLSDMSIGSGTAGWQFTAKHFDIRPSRWQTLEVDSRQHGDFWPLVLPGTPSSAPAKEMPPQVASVTVEAPADRIVELLDPLPVISIVDAPAAERLPTRMYAGVRMLMIRRKKMRKFKKKKHQKRDAFLLEKLRLQKQMKAEAFFRARMNELRNDMENFDPLQYAKGVIKSAERQWETRLTPSGKKRYNHWSEVISLEELYGIQPSTYIDKRAGLFTAPEDRAKFTQQRNDYLAKYTRPQPPKSTDEKN